MRFSYAETLEFQDSTHVWFGVLSNRNFVAVLVEMK